MLVDENKKYQECLLGAGLAQGSEPQGGAGGERREAGGCSPPRERIFGSLGRDTSSPHPSSLFSLVIHQPHVHCQARDLLRSRGKF